MGCGDAPGHLTDCFGVKTDLYMPGYGKKVQTQKDTTVLRQASEGQVSCAGQGRQGEDGISGELPGAQDSKN